MITSAQDMWRGNPVLTTVLFGLPFGFLCLICYSICCADIMDADDEEDEEEGEKSKPPIYLKHFLIVCVNNRISLTFTLNFFSRTSPRKERIVAYIICDP